MNFSHAIKHFILSHEDRESYKRPIFDLIIIANLFPSLLATIVNFLVRSESQTIVAELLPLCTTLCLISIFFISRKIKVKFPTFFLVALYSFISYSMVYYWGMTVTMSWLLLTLTVIMAGILVSARFSLLLLGVHSMVLSIMTYLQINGVIGYELWDTTPTYGSLIVWLFVLVVIGLVTWLSHLLIEQWIYKAKTSQRALKKQKRLLEMKVEERTHEINQLQLEKMQHLYRFAELGRLSSGLFHDLNNLLGNISLNLELMTSQAHSDTKQHAELIDPLERAVTNVKQLEHFTLAVKQQLKKNTVLEEFQINNVILTIIEVLRYKAREQKVKIELNIDEDVKIYGNMLRFGQLMTNLISNSIDAYDQHHTQHREVIVSASKQKKLFFIYVTDFGVGIKKSHLKKIFDPFFTTKSMEKGTGIGLTISRDIVEKDFGGSISVESKEGQGTSVVVTIPL